MEEIDLELACDCAKLLLEEIMKNGATNSQLKAKYAEKYSNDIIDMALEFLEDEKCIDSKKIEKLEYYSRITGYYQKVSGWNVGKLQEFRDRHRYSTG